MLVTADSDHRDARSTREPSPLPTVRRLTLRKRQRLHLQRDFRRVFARRCSAGDGRLVVYVDRNDLTFPRLGVVASRRVGKAVLRNRIKRLIREAFRLAQHELPAGLDILCIPKRDTAATRDEYRASLLRLVARAAERLE
jgi:ribonuclease P protein component